MLIYLDILKELVYEAKKTLKEGRNGKTYSVFGKQLKFNLKNQLPIVTTKKVFFRGIIEELLFILNGKTNTKELESKKVNIWKQNTSREFLDKIGKNYEEGEMGPMYGYNIRYYGKPYPDKQPLNVDQQPYFDQLQNVINLLINDPNSRRIIYTTYNPLNSEQGVLYPCHGLIVQFYVTIVGDVRYVKLHVYQRSADILLGLPFNITSYAVLAYILCDHINAIISDKKESGSNIKSGDSGGAGRSVDSGAGSSIASSTSGVYGNRSADCKSIDGDDKIIYKPDELIISLGDVHLYEEHLEAAKLQLTRQPFILPTLSIKPFKAIEELTYDHFILNNYVHHDAINAIMKS